MSRIGKKPIEIPGGVKIAVNEGDVVVEGPKGKLTHGIVDEVKIDIADNILNVQRVNDSRSARANQGLMRSLVANMIQGVAKGFERALEVSGVGYRAEMIGNKLELHLGFSHPVQHPIPDNVEVTVEKNTRIVVRGIDLQAVGQMAAVIRATKIPDPYKIKGVMYAGERIKKKAGKKAVS